MAEVTENILFPDILFQLVSLDGQIGYDVQVVGETVDLAQYLAGLNEMQAKYFDQCYGCDGCCWERAPLNGIDILRYVAALWPEQLEKAPYHFFLQNYAHVDKNQGVVDIALKREANGACTFLQQAKKYCTTHTCRSLVCQSYICIPQTERAELLRQQIVNAGIDDLVRRYLWECAAQGITPCFHSGDDSPVCLEDYPANGFSGKTAYGQVCLKDIVSSELWQQLQLPCTEMLVPLP